MYVSIKTVLEHPIFKNAEVIAGKDGIDRNIRRMSVFDCPINENLLDKKLIQSGDFFISGLYQFIDKPAEVKRLISILNEARCSGLCITDENSSIITVDTLEYADEIRFPILVFDKLIPYASIMDAINQMIFINYRNVLNEYKIEKLIYGNLDRDEVCEITESFDLSFDSKICIIAAYGAFKNNINKNNVYLYIGKSKNDCYVKYKSQHIIICSDGDDTSLYRKTRMFRNYLNSILNEYKSGISNIHEKYQIDYALKESRISLMVAQARDEMFVEYCSVGIMWFLISVKDNPQLLHYYEATMKSIAEYDKDNKLELMKYMKEYVSHRGNYGKMAVSLNQHVNTVRYRMNKIRALLGMEEDLIKFHETVSLLVEIDMIIRNR